MAGIDAFVAGIVLNFVRRTLLISGLVISLAGALFAYLRMDLGGYQFVQTEAKVVAVQQLCQMRGVVAAETVFDELLACAEVVRIRRREGVKYTSQQNEYATLEYSDLRGTSHSVRIPTFALWFRAKAGGMMAVAYEAAHPEVILPTYVVPAMLFQLAPMGLFIGPGLLFVWWLTRNGAGLGLSGRAAKDRSSSVRDTGEEAPARAAGPRVAAEPVRAVQGLGKRGVAESGVVKSKPLLAAPAQVWASTERATGRAPIVRVAPAGPGVGADRLARVVKRGEVGIAAAVAALPVAVKEPEAAHEVAEEAVLASIATIAEASEAVEPEHVAAVEETAAEVADVAAVAAETVAEVPEAVEAEQDAGVEPGLDAMETVAEVSEAVALQQVADAGDVVEMAAEKAAAEVADATEVAAETVGDVSEAVTLGAKNPAGATLGWTPGVRAAFRKIFQLAARSTSKSVNGGVRA